MDTLSYFSIGVNRPMRNTATVLDRHTWKVHW